MIARLLENKILARIQQSSKVILLYGSRQVGKTTLVKSMLKKLPYKTLQINADNREYADVLSSRDVGKLRRLVSGYELVFIDEAQRISDIGINLKIIHDEIPEVKVVATGSSSFELANIVREPLTGRTWTFTLYPISLGEFRATQNLFELDLRLEEFLLYGMYPEVFSYEGASDKVLFLKELSNSYLYKDILELGDIRHARKVHDLLRLLAYQIGSTVSLNELGRQLEMNKDTVARYIDLLEKAFIVFRLPGYSRNLRKEVVKMDKVYFYDLGVRNAVIDNFNNLDLRNDKGQLWENFLIAERLKNTAYQNTLANRYFWRTYTGAELDYIEESGGALRGYEFKWGSKTANAPQTWMENYPEASFECINRENYLDFVL
ncbi:MAG: ATP-binding protein, partial [Bacteroidota bacterium]